MFDEPKKFPRIVTLDALNETAGPITGDKVLSSGAAYSVWHKCTIRKVNLKSIQSTHLSAIDERGRLAPDKHHP